MKEQERFIKELKEYVNNGYLENDESETFRYFMGALDDHRIGLVSFLEKTRKEYELGAETHIMICKAFVNVLEEYIGDLELGESIK